MDVLKVRYCGRVSAGRLKKFTPAENKISAGVLNDYFALVMKVHGLDGLVRLRDYLGLSSLTNLQKNSEPRRGKARGSKGISGQGRLTVRDAALYLQETVGRSKLSFLTLTLPSAALTPELFQSWTEITRKLRQRLVYALEVRGLSPEIVGVVEIQEQRQISTGGMPALHWHLLFQGRKDYSSWALSPQFFRKLWSELLEDALGFPVDCSAACRVESVRSDASGYLAKYMSKGLKTLSTLALDYLPSSWYMCTRPLLQVVRQLTFYVSGSVATALYDLLMHQKGWLKFSKDIKITTDQGREITVGWYGDLKDRDTWRDFRSICWSVQMEELYPGLYPLDITSRAC